MYVDGVRARRFAEEEMRALHHTDDRQDDLSETAHPEARLPLGVAILVIVGLSALSWGAVISLAIALRRIL